MKITKTKLYLVALFLLSMRAEAQHVDKILAAHFKAIGQEHVMSMRSVSMEVREMNGFQEIEKYQVIKKMPAKIRISGTGQQTYVKAYDGSRAWTMWGTDTAEWMTDSACHVLLLHVGVGSPLYPYAKYERTLTWIGTEKIQGDAHDVIRLTRPSGFFVDYLLDKKDHLIHLVRIYEAQNAEEIAMEIIFKNYKTLGSFTMPFGYEKRGNNSTIDVVIDHVVFGQGAPDSLFAFPD